MMERAGTGKALGTWRRITGSPSKPTPGAQMKEALRGSRGDETPFGGRAPPPQCLCVQGPVSSSASEVLNNTTTPHPSPHTLQHRALHPTPPAIW